MTATLSHCPECGCEWDYERNGKTYSHLIGIYDPNRDRTVAWRCPGCGHEWERGSRAILKATP